MIFIVLSIFLFSLNNVLWKKNLQACSVPFLVAYRALFTSLGSIVILVYNYGFDIFHNQPIGKITLGSLFGVFGLFLMLNIIKKAPLQWIGIYNLVGIVFTAIYLYYFENTSIQDSILGYVLIILGFILYIYHNKNEKTTISKLQHLYLIGMTFSFGISSLIHWKNLGTKVPAILIISNQELVVFITASCISLTTLKLSEIKTNIVEHTSNAIGMALIIFLALFFSFSGLQVTNPLFSSILFLATPLLTIVFGALFFREKMSLINIIAILIIAIGAYLLHYQNN